MEEKGGSKIAEVGVLMYIRGNKMYILNILVMMVNWSCSSFCFYLIPYFIANLNSQELGSSSLNVF